MQGIITYPFSPDMMRKLNQSSAQSVEHEVPEPIGTESSMNKLPEDYQKRFRQLAENLLAKKNQYLASKKVTDELKSQQDEAEQALLTYIETTGCSAIAFEGLGRFSRSEEYYGNVTKPNIEKVKK